MDRARGEGPLGLRPERALHGGPVIRARRLADAGRRLFARDDHHLGHEHGLLSLEPTRYSTLRWFPNAPPNGGGQLSQLIGLTGQ